MNRSFLSQPYLPASILWRQKEQFSDGVGYSWIDGLKGHAESAVSDEDFARRAERWPEGTPDTKEGYYIRDVFDGALLSTSSFFAVVIQSFLCLGLFPSKAAAKTAVRWIPRGDWGCSSDPSGRSVSIHNAAYESPMDE